MISACKRTQKRGALIWWAMRCAVPTWTRVGVRSGDAALGLSLAGLHDGSGLPNRHLLGADIQWSFNSLSAKAEYVRRWPAARSQDGVQHGAYAQGTWENQRYFAVVRLGALETNSV